MYLTDTQVEKACATLRKAIEAAENSNHSGEVFVVAAAAVLTMKEALESASWLLADISPNGLVKQKVDSALAVSEGRAA